MTKNNWTDGDSVTATQLNRMEDQLVITCTSGTRPTGVEGQRIWETDSNREYVYDGVSWVCMYSPTTTFTPSWSNVTVSNGTSSGYYRYGSGRLFVVADLVIGSSTTISGAVSFTIPDSVTAQNPSGAYGFGLAYLIDATPAGSEIGMARCGTGADTSVEVFSADQTAVTSTVPFTWSTGDRLHVEITVLI